MACPVNHPFFHALVFFIGALIVLSRYVRGDDISGVVARAIEAGVRPDLDAVGRPTLA